MLELIASLESKFFCGHYCDRPSQSKMHLTRPSPSLGLLGLPLVLQSTTQYSVCIQHQDIFLSLFPSRLGWLSKANTDREQGIGNSVCVLMQYQCHVACSSCWDRKERQAAISCYKDQLFSFSLLPCVYTKRYLQLVKHYIAKI